MIDKEKYLKLFFLIMAGFSVLAGYNFIRSISVPLFIEYFGKDRMPEALYRDWETARGIVTGKQIGRAHV